MQNNSRQIKEELPASIGTRIKKELDTSSGSGNDAHADEADIKPIYDEEPMAENAEQCHDTCPLPAKLIDNQTTELSNQSLKSENISLKEGQQSQFSKVKSNEAKVKPDIDVIETINIELEHKVAKLLKENDSLKKHYKELYDSIKTTRARNIEHTTSFIAKNDEFKAQLQEKGFTIAALKNELRKLTGNRRESVVAKPHHNICTWAHLCRAQMTWYHKHYLEELRKKTQESSKEFRTLVYLPSARSQSTTNGSKPKPRINNQKSRNWPASKSSCVTTKIVPIAGHSRNSSSFSDSKHFVCSTCQKCVFNANHDSCAQKFLNEVNIRARVPSTKTTKYTKPVEAIQVSKNQKDKFSIGHRFSIKKTSVVHEKTITPRSCLRWKPTGNIFKAVGLKWILAGKIFTSSTTKVDSEPTNGSNDDITNKYECEQILDVSAGTLNLSASTSFNPKKEGLRFKAGSKRVVPTTDNKLQSQQELGITISPSHNNAEDSHKDGDGDALFQLKSDSLPHAHAQTTKTYYKHQDSRIMKAQELKTKTSAQTLIYKIFLQRYQVYQGRLLASFQDDAKYEHVGQDTRSQGGKDDQDGRIKI
ncbi:hypothetical protein Tco_0735370 [Tanacetum coccineum]